MTPDSHMDENQTASHMPSEADRRLLLSAVATRDQAIQSWDVARAYARALNDLRYHVKMHGPLCAHGMYAALGKICLIRRPMQGAPDAN